MEERLYMQYWGKARPVEMEGPQYHLLAYHCLDVAAVAWCWWSQSRAIRRQFAKLRKNLTDSQLQAWVIFFIALHDLGKLDIRFQMKAKGAFQDLQLNVKADDLPPSGESKGYQHGEMGYAWFMREYPAYLTLDKNEEVLDAWLPWLGAVAGHHGKIPKHRSSASKPDAEPYLIDQDSEARKRWIESLASLFLAPVGLSLHPQSVPTS